MINVREYRGHIRNWEALCGELGVDKTLSREEREEQILVLVSYTHLGLLFILFHRIIVRVNEESNFCAK